MKPVFIDGKARLEDCWNCGQSKAKVDYYRKRKDPRFCVTVESNESGSEVSGEWDKHRFVLSEKMYLADIESEKLYWENEDKRLEALTSKGKG